MDFTILHFAIHIVWRVNVICICRKPDITRKTTVAYPELRFVDSRVLVLPDYKNTSMQSEIGDYGYRVGHGVIRKGKEKFNISAQIHTHQERMSDERASEADGLFSKKMGGLPVLVIGKDKVTRGFYYDFNDGKSFGFGNDLKFHELNILSLWLNQHRRFFLQVK